MQHVAQFESTKIGQAISKSHRYVPIGYNLPSGKQQGFVPFSGQGNVLGSNEDEGEESRLIIAS